MQYALAREKFGSQPTPDTMTPAFAGSSPAAPAYRLKQQNYIELFMAFKLFTIEPSLCQYSTKVVQRFCKPLISVQFTLLALQTITANFT